MVILSSECLMIRAIMANPYSQTLGVNTSLDKLCFVWSNIFQKTPLKKKSICYFNLFLGTNDLGILFSFLTLL